MTAIMRDFVIVNVDAVPGEETNVTIPVESNFLEVVALYTQDDATPPVEADARMAFEEGETADGGNYLPLNPDYWTPNETRFNAGKVIYLRSEIANEFKVKYGIGN